MRGACLDRVAYGMHQMRFAKADTAVYEQRIVSGTRCLGGSLRRGVCKLVAGADHEFLERIFRIQKILDRLDIDKVRRCVAAGYDLDRVLARGKKEVGVFVRMRVDWLVSSYLPSDRISLEVDLCKRMLEQGGVILANPILGNLSGLERNRALVVVGPQKADGWEPRVIDVRV